MARFSKEDERFIKLMYRDARDKANQVKILSQILDCYEVEVWDFLKLPMPIKKKRVFKSTYTEEQKQECINALYNGAPQADLAKKYGIATSTICRWARVVKESVNESDWNKFKKGRVMDERRKEWAGCRV